MDLRPHSHLSVAHESFFQLTVHCKIAEATCSSVCGVQFLKGLLVLLFSVPGKVKFIVNLKYLLLKEMCLINLKDVLRRVDLLFPSDIW